MSDCSPDGVGVCHTGGSYRCGHDRASAAPPRCLYRAQGRSRLPSLEVRAEIAQLLVPQTVIEKRDQDGPIALAFERVRIRCRKQAFGLVVGKHQRLTFVGVFTELLHALTPVTMPLRFH